jgi:RNA polymerase sigma-70 factor (ECF subfamily)
MKVRGAARIENDVISRSEVRERAFEALYAAHYQAIVGYVLRRVPADETHDVIAQVFTVAWRRLDSVPPPPADLLWLFGVARNSVADQLRARRRRLHLWARLTLEAAAPDSHASAADPSGEQVRAAMRALRPADREAIQLVLWDELSHAEAAAVLGCSPNAFELRYRRARKAVRDALIANDTAAEADREQLMPPSQKPRTHLS